MSHSFVFFSRETNQYTDKGSGSESAGKAAASNSKKSGDSGASLNSKTRTGQDPYSGIASAQKESKAQESKKGKYEDKLV